MRCLRPCETLKSSSGGSVVHAEFGRLANRAPHGCCLKQLLGGYAAPMQARAAQPVPLHQRDLHARSAGIQRRSVARGPAADHDEVVTNRGARFAGIRFICHRATRVRLKAHPFAPG